MATSDLYIPAQGVVFRLHSKASEKVLYLDPEKKPPVFHAPPDDNADDQWFYLQYGTENNRGKYAIRSKESNKALYSRSSKEPKVGHVEDDNVDIDNHPENWHTFEPGKGENAGWFRIITEAPGGKVLIISRNHAQPNVTNYPTSIAVYPDHFFRFELEEVTLKANSFKWRFETAKIISREQKDVGDIVFENNSDCEQTFSFNLTEDVSVSGKSELTGGFPVKIPLKLTSEMPTIANSDQIVSNNDKIEWTVGTPVSTNKLNTTERSFDVDAKSTVHVFARAAVVNVEIPFDVYVKGKRTSSSALVTGVWRGTISGVDTQYEVKKE